MIKSFKHKGLARFFATGSKGGISPNHAKKLGLILLALDAAKHPGQMDIAGFRYHPLTGPMAGMHAVSVDGNTRVTFRFENGNATEVDYGDYH